MLTITEELFLLSLVEKKNSVAVPSSMELGYSLAGALLVELALNGRLVFVDKQKLKVVNGLPLGIAWLDDLLEQMLKKGQPKKTTYWISMLGASPKKLIQKLLASLQSKGVLNEEEKRFLWMIPYAEYSLQNASAKYTLKQQLRAVVLGGETATSQWVILLSLLKACNMLDHLFTRDEYKSAQKQVAALTAGEAFGQAVNEVMEEVMAAISAATLVASTSG
jgi:Golgi phosphoprotein 3